MTRVAVVTGGAKGIGRAISKQLAAEGNVVVVCGRDTEALAAQVEELRDLGHHATSCAMDVGDPDSVRAGFAGIRADHPKVDVLVNCAGVIVRSDAVQYSDDEWRQVIDTDLNGPFWCARAVAPGMLVAGGGSIVNVGSIAALTGISSRASYTAAKAGLTGLTRTLALEWASRDVRVNTVAPGWTMTDMVRGGIASGRLDEDGLLSRIPMGRLAMPEEIASVVSFVASEKAHLPRHVT